MHVYGVIRVRVCCVHVRVVSGFVVHDSCLDIINVACGDGFPSENLLLSNTTLYTRRKSWPVMAGNY